MAVEAIVSVVFGKLTDFLIQQAHLLRDDDDDVREQIEWLKTELESMLCFLKDAGTLQRKDERIKNWVAQIRDISYDVEDVIDTFIAEKTKEIQQRRSERIFEKLKIGKKGTVGEKIQQIKERITDVSRRRETYGPRDINEGGVEATSTDQNLLDRRRYFALLEEPDVVGFEEDRKTLQKQLINGDSGRAVISIVGMGGSGKTTLAKKVYRDVEKYFDCRAFIHLSQQYKIRDILIRILQGVMSVSKEEKREMEEEDEQDLGKKLSDHLTTKRYLVVIDDIWTTEAWDVLNLVLPCVSKKSRVILTTRNREVAMRADPFNPPHEIRLLDDGESWELFLKKIFPPGSTCPSELEDIGRKILAKCGHLPLAIVVLGGLLSTKEKTLSAWLNVLKSVTWRLAGCDDKCMEVLALSYYDLPRYLKPCFLYLGLFPEDFEIKSERLIRLWIAEGFVQQRGDMILEDVAEEYLVELIGRNMLQVASKKCNGSVRTCRIHDLLRDLSVSEAKQNNFFEIINNIDVDTGSSLTSKCRRVALYRERVELQPIKTHSTAILRSVLSFGTCKHARLNLIGEGGKLLRVFDDVDVDLSQNDFAKVAGEFVHLRYLSSSSILITIHPSFIANLHNLQTLELRYFDAVLPNAMYDLVRLRHLSAYDCQIEGQPRLDNLRNLQTLCLTAGSWIENGLDKLTNLRKLKINFPTASYINSLSDSIEKLCMLRSIKIVAFGLGADLGVGVHIKSLACHLHLYKMSLDVVLDKLPDLPSSLVKLTLDGTDLQNDDIIKLEKLPKLRILKLGPEWTCLDKWICSSPGFPKLEILKVHCYMLKEFIIEEGAMPCLKNMELFGAENLTTDPVSAREYSIIDGSQGSFHRFYEIRSMASTVLERDNASQHSK